MDAHEALAEAVRVVGTQTKLAQKVGVTQQTVSYWLNTLKHVPAEFAPKVERATDGKVKRNVLRPDVFGSEAA